MADDWWSTYARWNDALCDVIFTSQRAGEPVYLDMDEETLAAVAGRVGVGEGEASDRLAAAVRATIHLEPYGSVFEDHLARLREWRRSVREARASRHEPDPPPVVALLAAFTLAAEQMGADSEHRPHAYYPRLCDLLKVGDEAARDRLQIQYRQHAETLWRALNEWLSATEGRYGLPTAYALSHRYVGLPMSQALVRAGDRRRFPRMFAQFGLPPGAEVSPTDMVPLLDQWIQQNPSPASRNIQSLWRHGAARERIASVAAVELLHWDGHVEGEIDQDVAPRGSVRLLALLRRFPQPQLEISFVAQLRTPAVPDALVVTSADQDPQLDVVPATGGQVRPRSMGGIDPGSLIEGLLRIRDPISGHEAARHPRRIVPLRRDELLNAYTECERVHLGEDVMLLVKDDPTLRRDVSHILGQVARPGFQDRTALRGLPDGWVLITDVQIMGALESETRFELNALTPILSSQLTLAGGLKLPGRVAKWSSRRPPEVRAVVQQADKVSVTLTPLDDDAPTHTETWESESPALVVDLAEGELPEGDYELTLKSDRRLIRQLLLRLRSSDTPDPFGWAAAPRLVHDLSNPGSVMTADVSGNGTESVAEGAWSPQLSAASPSVRAEGAVWWTEPKPVLSGERPLVVVAPLDPASCVSTGAHRIVLPTFYGRATTRLIEGRCTQCGLVKRYPAWSSAWRSSRRGRERRVPTPSEIEVGDLPSVTHNDVGWDDALDALVHVGGGSFGWLERVALQMEGSSLFVDTFTRAVESLGHVEVRRGKLQQPLDWVVSPPYLAELDDGSLLLTGAWTPSQRARLGERVEALGGKLRSRSADESERGVGPTRWVIVGAHASDASAVADDVGAAGVVPEAGRRLLQALPPLGDVRAALPKLPMPGTRNIQRFHLPSASWTLADDASQPGAYRILAASSSKDVFRDQEDAKRGEWTVGTVQLVKHLEARRVGRALVAYDPATARLAVPLGADLPGLYGRAVVLCSGQLPTPVPPRRCLVYHDVPRDVADLLVSLLTT